MYGLGSDKGLEPISELYFWSLLMNSEDDYEIPFDIYGDSLKVKTLVEGVSSGILVGGNLSLICSAMGSKYEYPQIIQYYSLKMLVSPHIE